jgi:hypothetical protein
VPQPEAQPIRLLPLVLALFGLIVAFHLVCAARGGSLMRPQHLGTALEYARGPIHLLHPVIVGFNATSTPTAQELPLWQAAVALVFKAVGSTWYGWANIVSLAFFATALWPLLSLGRDYVGERAAWWGLAFFLAQPIVVEMAGEASTDGFCLAAMIWFLFFANRMIRSGSALWWLPATLFGAVTALSKAPFFLVAGLVAAGMIRAGAVRGWRPWALLAGSGAVASALFLAWTSHTSALAAQAVYPFTELRLSKSDWLVFWFFGDFGQRLDPVAWARGGWRFLHATLGSLPLVALLVAGLARPGNALLKWWLGAMLLATLIFTNLVLAHWHYYLTCSPAVALLCGVAVSRWESFWALEMPSQILRIGLAGAVLVLSTVEGLVTMKINLASDPFYRTVSRKLQEHTQPDDKLLIYNYHLIWGGEVLFRSHRQGLVVATLEGGPGLPAPKGLRDLLGNRDDLERLKRLGYNKVVLISQSPLQFAVMAARGGQPDRGRYPATLSPEVDRWPVVYQSDDLLIKTIP